MENHVMHIGIEVERRFFVYAAREVQVVVLDQTPCGHEECREQLSYSPILAYGFEPQKVAKKAARKIIRQRIQERKDARDRAASEALGG